MTTPRIFVMGGWRPNGGALMAYEIGQIAAEIIGGEVYVVCDRAISTPSDLFEYSASARYCDLAQFHLIHTAQDVLVLNPSYHADLYSLAVTCRIVSYVQSYKTFWHLDPGVHLYVAVSEFVQSHIKHNDAVTAEIISPFLPSVPDTLIAPLSNKDQLGYKSFKGDPKTTQAINMLMERDSPRFHELLPNSQGNRKQLLDELARSRIYFSAVTAEGFGLIPLEAMSLGCIVLGLDGHGSRDYLRHGENSFCVKLKNLRLLPGLFNEIVDSLDEMDSIVDNAIETASYYSYERFRLAWTKVLERFL